MFPSSKIKFRNIPIINCVVGGFKTLQTDSQNVPEISDLRVLGDSLSGEVAAGNEEAGPEVDPAAPTEDSDVDIYKDPP